MASDDDSLIAEARSITDYDDSIISDSEFEELVNIGKEEIMAAVNEQTLMFYEEETFHHTRALFWFTAIAAKVKTGELAGMNISADDFEATNPATSHYSFWFDSFQKKMAAARLRSSPGPSLVNMERTERTYGDQ